MNKKLKPTITQLRPPPMPMVQTSAFKAGFICGAFVLAGIVAALPYVVRWLA